MARKQGSSAAQTAERVDTALQLLDDGTDRSIVIRNLASRYNVTPSTARRYVAAAEQQLLEESSLGDLYQQAGWEIRRLRRLSSAAEQSGNHTAAISAGRAVAHILTSFHRCELTSVAKLSGHTLAMPDPPLTERQRRKHRRSVDDLPADYPH